MKTNLQVTYVFLVLFASILLNGCNNGDSEVAPKRPDQPNLLSKAQIAAIHEQADQIANAEMKRLKSGENLRNPGQYDFVALNVTGVTPTGPTSANYGFNTHVQDPSSLNPGQVASYNYLFCAAPSHFRYAVVYFYNGYTHSASSIDAIYGPTGGCLNASQSKSFSVGMPGANTSQTFFIVFDVYNGPGGGSSQIAGPIWSNERELTYPNQHILNPGFYWY
jgi:hypothetical protein